MVGVMISDASFSKGVEYIASQISVDVEDALAGVGPSAKIVFNRIVPKSLCHDFVSWVRSDLFGSAGTLDQEFCARSASRRRNRRWQLRSSLRLSLGLPRCNS